MALSYRPPRSRLPSTAVNRPSADIEAYRITSDWAAASVTWNSQPATGAVRESVTHVTGVGTWTWEITGLVQDWYAGKQPNLGVMLRYADETLVHKEFRSSRWEKIEERPKLTITYHVDGLGRERFWGYAGDMNIANGNLVLGVTDTAIPARGLPATISRTYNSRSTQDGAFGYGWSSELDMRLHIPAMPDGSPRGPIMYRDLDGTVHYFSQNADGTYASPPGLYLTLRRETDGTFKVSEKGGLVYRYGGNGKLLSITDKNENVMTITYDASGLATAVTDAAGRAVSLSWSTNGKVGRVTNQGGTVIAYAYDSAGNLTAVTYASGQSGAQTVRYAYNTNHKLTAVTLPDGNKTYYFYTADGRLLSVNPVNAVINANFEVDGDGDKLPDFWTLDAAFSTSARLSSTPSAPFGEQYLGITPVAPNPTATAYGVYVSTPIPVTPSQTYQLSGYLRSSETTGRQKTVLSVLAYDANGYYLGEYARTEAANSVMEWTRYSASLPANALPAGTATVRLKAGASNTGGMGTSSFDALQFEEGSVVTEFSAPVTYTSSGFASAMYDGNGRKVKWTYNEVGNPLTESIDPAGLNHHAQFAWVPDKPNLLAAFKDPVASATGGRGTAYEYDANGNLTKTIDPLGNTTTLDYNSINDLVAFTDPNAYARGIRTPQIKATYDNRRNISSVPDRQGMASAISVDLDACPGCILGQTPALSLADNLLTNASFERSASNAWPDGWSVSGGSSTWTRALVYSGERAIALSPSGQAVSVRHTADLPVEAGANYVLSLYMRADTPELGAAAQGRMDFLDSRGTVVSTIYSNLFKRAHEWNRSVASAIAPQGATHVRVLLVANPAASAGNVYFDNVQLEKAPHLSEFNLLDNAGFERANPYVDFWQSSNQPFGWGDVAFAGRRSVTLSNATATSGFEPTYLIRYEPARHLTLSAFVKTDAVQNGRAFVKLKWYNAEGAVLGDTPSTTMRTGTNDWSRLYVQVPPGGAPAAAVYVKPSLVVQVDTGRTVGTAYFDAVRLEEAPVATEYRYGAPGESAHNNWVTKITDPLGNFLDATYNEAGFLTKVTPNGNASQAITYLPDSLQRLQRVDLPNGLTTTYGYTGNGMLKTVTHSGTDGTATTTYGYNRRDQLVQITDPLGRVTHFTYGPDGNLMGMRQPNGAEISLGYDAANRLSQRSFSGTHYTFQHNGNGALTQASDLTRTWQYGYDAGGRLTTTTNLAGRIAYEYDRNANLTSLTATVGANTFANTYVYDELDRLTRVEDRSGTRHVRFSYNERGALIKWATTGDVYAALDYDGAGRLVKQQNLKIDGTLLASYGYTYDNRGNRVTETTTTPNGTTTRTYAYDSLNQLTSDGVFTYSYTPRGNRKTRIGGGVTEHYCYDAADQLIYRGPSSCGTTTNFTYDTNGNMTQNASGSATWAYQYDAENRLTEVRKNGTVAATFTYDFAGRRQSKTASGLTRTYHYDGMSNRVLYETDGSGNVVVWYTWAGDQVVSQTRGTATYFYLYNGHGDVVALVDGIGTVVNAYTYDAWGTPDAANSWEQVENPCRYAGYRWDTETELYFLNARYYNPGLGRFLTRDPYRGEIDEPLSQNPYTYAHNNPVNLTDPSGYCPWCVAGAFLGAGIKGTLYIMAHRENVTLGGLAMAMATGAFVGGTIPLLPWTVGIGKAFKGIVKASLIGLAENAALRVGQGNSPLPQTAWEAFDNVSGWNYTTDVMPRVAKLLVGTRQRGAVSAGTALATNALVIPRLSGVSSGSRDARIIGPGQIMTPD